MAIPRKTRSCGLLIAAASLTIYVVVPSSAVYARQPSEIASEPASTPTAKNLTDLAENPAPLPVLTGNDAERVEELEKKIGELREQAKFADAITMAEKVLSIRGLAQGADWWETADAARLVETLRMIADWGPDKRRRLEDDEKLPDRLWDAQRRRQPDVMKTMLLESLETRRDLFGPDHPQVAHGLATLGRLHYQYGPFAEAGPYFEQALAAYQNVLGEEHPRVAEVLMFRAWLRQKLGDLTEAEKDCREALGMRRRLHGEVHVEVVKLLNTLGLILQDRGDLDAAHEVYLEALSMRKGLLRRHHHRFVAQTLDNLGRLLQRKGDYCAAEANLRQALSIRRLLSGADNLDVASSLNNLGSLQKAMGRFDEAEQSFLQALAIRKELLGPAETRVGISYSNLGALFFTVGRLGKAGPLMEKALEIYSDSWGENHATTASGVNNLGRLEYGLGNRTAAEEHFRRALSIWERRSGAEHPSVALALMNLAMVLSEGQNATGRDEADNAYRQSTEIFRTHADHRLYQACTLYGEFLTRVRHQPGDAIPLFSEAIKAVEWQRLRVAGDELDRSRYFSVLSKFNPYAGMVRARIALAEAAGHADPNASQELKSAFAYLERGRGRALLELLERSDKNLYDLAVSAAAKTGDGEGRRAIEAARRRVTEARVHRLSIVRRLAAVQGATSTHGDGPERRRLQLLTERNAAQQAERHAKRALFEIVRQRLDLKALNSMSPSEVAKLLHTDELLLAYDVGPRGSILLVLNGNGDINAFRLQWRDGSSVDAISLMKRIDAVSTARGGATAQADGTGVSSAASVEAELFDALIPAGIRHELLGARNVLIVTHGPLHRLPFESLVVDTPNGRRWLDDGPPVIYGSSATLLMTRRQRAASRKARALSSNTAKLVALGNPLFAHVRGKDVDAEEPILTDGALITIVSPESNAARHGIKVGDVLLSYDDAAIAIPKDFERIRKKLSSSAVAIGPGEAKNPLIPVTVSRNGRIVILPVEPGLLGFRVSALPMPDALNEFRYAHLTPVDQAASAARTPTSKAFAHLPPLPGTQLEIDTIKAIFDRQFHDRDSSVRALSGRGAHGVALWNAVDPPPRFLHLATHGLSGSGGHAYDNGLVLAAPESPAATDGGLLRLEDLLDRWGGRLNGTELVVLSACRTARGPLESGEGFVALTWGFLYAGADAVVASLWKVDDTATALLMTRLYENLLGAFDERRGWSGRYFEPGKEMPKAAALHEAKHWLRNLDDASARRHTANLYAASRRRGARWVPVEAAASDGADRRYVDPFYWGAFILIGDGS